MSVDELFWTGQAVYIQDIFLPVIIGVLVFVPVLAVVFAYGFGRRYMLWHRGQPEDRSGNWFDRLMTTLAVGVANIRIIRHNELYPGIMHVMIFGGTFLLVLGKIVRLFSYTVDLTYPPQAVFLAFSLVSEIGGALIIIGGVMAVIRRFILRPSRLDNNPEDSLIYIWVFLIVLTGYMIKGYRIAVSDISPDDWAAWSPIGYLISHAFPTFLTEAKNEIFVWHRVLFHTVPAFIFLGYIWIKRSRLQHILISPLNVFFRKLGAKGALTAVDFDATELFGTAKIEDFTWKQLMDLDACTRCGRCQDACPAYFSGKALSPKQVILDLKDHLNDVYPNPISLNPAESRSDMIDDVITDEVIWDCTTCRACQQACPVYIEHIDKVVDMRRNLAMERSQFPESVQEALKCLGSRMHPYRGTTNSRTTWCEDIEVKLLSDDSDVDILYWVGCSAALDDRNIKVALAMAKILNAAGIKFGILGDEEACCGDPARRLGDEYLFQTICQQNIEILNGYGVKKILTTCPHCFNSLKHEYPQFGGNYEVVHHTQFIADLLKDDKLEIISGDAGRITYHDSCYLGRYNDIYEQPREILTRLTITPVELPRNRSNSFCCGGGGGHMWMEEDADKRVSTRRIEEIIAADVGCVASACPYCLTMFDDALKAKEVEESIKAFDLSELIAARLKDSEG
jgi:Fe-S oxidoreductase/nitrate reductase gamma subunit